MEIKIVKTEMSDVSFIAELEKIEIELEAIKQEEAS